MIKIYKEGNLTTEEIMSRDGEGFDASAIVREIIANVRKNGDAALREYCEKFDGGARKPSRFRRGDRRGICKSSAGACGGDDGGA